MRTPDPHVYHLVKNLTRGEMDAYNNWVKSIPIRPNYDYLYRIYFHQTKVNEDEAIRNFSRECPKVSFIETKNQLKRILYRIMVRGFGSEKSTPYELVELVKVLRKRELTSLAYKELRSAKKILEAEERFYYLLELAEVELELLVESLNEEHFLIEKERIFKEIAEVQAKVLNLDAYRNAHINHYFTFKKKHYQSGFVDRNQIGLILEDPIFERLELALSKRAKREYLFQVARVRFFQMDFEASLSALEMLNSLYENVPFLKAENEKHYFQVISQICSLNIHLGQIEQAKRWLGRLDFSNQKEPTLSDFIFDRYVQNILNLIDRSPFDDNGKWVWEFPEKIEAILKRPTFNRSTYTLVFSFGLYFLKAGSENFGFKYFQAIANRKDYETAIDLQCMARILILLISERQQEFDYLENQIRTFQRFFKKVGTLNGFEQSLIKFLRLAIAKSKSENPHLQELLRGQKEEYKIWYDLNDWFKNHSRS